MLRLRGICSHLEQLSDSALFAWANLMVSGEGILHQEVGNVALVPAFALTTDVNMSKSTDHPASQISYLQGKGSNTDRRGTDPVQST